MTRCDELQEQISALVDQELPEKGCARVREHLGLCGECQRVFEELKQSKTLLKRAYHYETPPSSLWQKASVRMDALDRSMRPAVRRVPFRLAPVLGLMLIALAAIAGYRFWDEHRPQPLNMAALTCFHRTFPMPTSQPIDPACIPNPKIMALTMSEKLGQPVQAPPLTYEEGFIGGRICSRYHRPYVQFTFRQGQTIYSLFEIPSAQLQPLPPPDACLGTGGFYPLYDNGLNGLAWQKGDLTYVVVSEASLKDLLTVVRRLKSTL